MRLDPAADPRAPLLVLAHGAGAGHGHPWIRRVALGLSGRGVHVVTFDFPYKAAGRKLPDPGATLEAAFADAWRSAAGLSAIAPARMVAGGKSMGGRIASQVAAQSGFDPAPAGLVFFGYPLHPPGRPSQRRDRHLSSIGCPMLFVHGTRDPFGSAEEMIELTSQLHATTLELVQDGDHSLICPKRQDPEGRALDAAMDTAAAWIQSLHV